MINKKSLITPYDEPLTLVEWLQKVSKALNESVLTNLGIAKLSDQDNVATYQVTATFADNTTIVSDTFTLPSTDIVTAFGNLATLVNGFDTRITDNTNNVGSILDIIDIGNDKINTSTLQNSINGGDDVIVDVDNDKLEIHLSAELQAKLARVLLKPSSAPSTRKVVTIDTNGAQDNVDGTELTTLMNNIVDSHGNKRFVEGNLEIRQSEHYNFTYYKWSLCGTHLMLVLAGTCTGITSQPFADIATIKYPSYISNKIVAMFGMQVSFANAIYRATDAEVLTAPIIAPCLLTKDNGSVIYISILPKTNIFDSTKTYAFRIQFDLLIDSE